MLFIGLALYAFSRNRAVAVKITNLDTSHNPFTRQARKSKLSLEEEHYMHKEISDFVTYNAKESSCIERCAVIQSQTQCIFASNANLWGSLDWDESLSILQNVLRFLPTFLKFTLCCEQLQIDGFVVELPECYGDTVEVGVDVSKDQSTLISCELHVHVY